MGTTPTYNWLYPQESDTPDVPRDLSSLATAADSTMSGEVANRGNRLYSTALATAPQWSNNTMLEQFTDAQWPPVKFYPNSPYALILLTAKLYTSGADGGIILGAGTASAPTGFEQAGISGGGTLVRQYTGHALCTNLNVGTEVVVHPNWSLYNYAAGQTVTCANATLTVIAFGPLTTFASAN